MASALALGVVLGGVLLLLLLWWQQQASPSPAARRALAGAAAGGAGAGRATGAAAAAGMLAGATPAAGKGSVIEAELTREARVLRTKLRLPHWGSVTAEATQLWRTPAGGAEDVDVQAWRKVLANVGQVAALFLLVRARDKEHGEAMRRAALRAGVATEDKVFDAKALRVPVHRILLYTNDTGKIAIVRQLRPHAHLDNNGNTTAALRPHVPLTVFFGDREALRRQSENAAAAATAAPVSAAPDEGTASTVPSESVAMAPAGPTGPTRRTARHSAVSASSSSSSSLTEEPVIVEKPLSPGAVMDPAQLQQQLQHPQLPQTLGSSPSPPASTDAPGSLHATTAAPAPLRKLKRGDPNYIACFELAELVD